MNESISMTEEHIPAEAELPTGQSDGTMAEPSDVTDIAEELFEDEGGADLPTDEEDDLPDYGKELMGLRREFPDLISPEDGERYSTLRAMGLTPREAYLATSAPRARSDSRAHLGGGTPKRAHSPYSGMTRQALESARSLFEGLGDAEIQRLYRRVTK